MASMQQQNAHVIVFLCITTSRASLAFFSLRCSFLPAGFLVLRGRIAVSQLCSYTVLHFDSAWSPKKSQGYISLVCFFTSLTDSVSVPLDFPLISAVPIPQVLKAFFCIFSCLTKIYPLQISLQVQSKATGSTFYFSLVS